MGNTQSVPAEGQAISSSQQLETSIQSSTKSWATMDHTISGPWSFLVKEEVQCLCEGGRNCSHENPARQQAPNAIAGLHSSWVGDQVLAMARPWQENVLKHDVVAQFKQHNIGMILNLQEVGEHDSCGPGNLAVSGFTYNPETFMAARIGVYNISWRDMGVPTLEKIMDIVQIMQYTTMVECRKVAVHCHAGLGRTGLAIACFLVASGQACSAAKAIEMVRAARPGSLQTQTQVMFVSIFEQYLQHLRCLFKVADLKHLSLGNTNYIVTKVCRRISRSMSGQHQASSASTPDALAAAAAALGPLAFTPTGSGGSSAPNSATAAAAAAAAAQGQADWTTATYDVMSPAEAAQLQAGSTTAAEAAANAALNLGAPGAGGAGTTGVAGQEGLVMHARRLSGGGAMKMVSNLKAIEEEGDKPVHVIQTDNAVTEVYGHGLTIIRATDSVKKMYASPAGAKPAAEQQLPTPHELGLDKQLPWTDKFAIRPEAFKAEGWLPQPPDSYLEALRRQQRLLHGSERRRCLHQHKLLRSAAKALSAAAVAYKSVPAHTDPAQIVPAATGTGPPSPPFKRSHSRSRSNASAIDLLAISGSPLSPCGSGLPLAERTRSASTGGQQPPSSAALSAAASVGNGIGNAGSNSLLSKQQQQLLSASGSQSPAGATAAAATGATTSLVGPDSAAALLPGLQLGPPGTIPSPFASSAGAASSSGARKLAHQSSSSKKRSSGANSLAGAAAGGFFLSSDGSSSPAGAAGAGGVVASCTPCLSGCCAPSYAVGLLIALLYKGRFPEEYEAQWAGCPRLKALGLDEGHAVCQALQDVKLAVNAGSHSQLEAASGAVAVCVLADWFEGFTYEAFSESTLELLVDDAEALLAEALAAAAAAKAHEDLLLSRQQLQQDAARSSIGPSSNPSGSALPGHLPPLSAPTPAVTQDGAGAGQVQVADDAATLARKAAARAVCSSLAPYEQDLCLLLAAVLRHARHASLDDPRLQELGLNYSTIGGNPTGSGRLSGGGATSGSGGSQAAAVEAQVDAAMAVLYRLVAGWLLGPLALACVPALEAVAAFLHYLTVDDTAYACLLQAIQQGVRRARSAPAGKDGLASLWDSQESGGSAPGSPRQHHQQQQNLDRLEKLKARLLGAGSSFKLKPLSAYYKQTKQYAAAGGATAGLGLQSGGAHAVKFAEAPALLGGQAAAGAGGSMGSGHGGAAAAQHGLGKSKLRHASSSPELCIMQQQEPAQHLGAPKHAKSKLGAAARAGAGADAPTKSSSTQQQQEPAGGAGANQGSAPSPEPQSCAGSWTSMLSQKLRSKSSKKHQQPPQQAHDSAHDQEQQQSQHGEPAAASGQGEKGQQQHQQQLQVHEQQQLQPQSPASAASSCCGDSTSELIAAGNCQGLCVGRQGPEQRVGHLAEELAVLTGQPIVELEGAGIRGEGPGALDSPPRSVSPDLSSPTAAARRHPCRSNSSGGGSRQHPLHMRHPPMRTSLQGVHSSLDGGGSDAGSSYTTSPCSSMGSITGFILAAQQHQGYSLQQMARGADAVSGSAAAASAGGASSERPGSSSSANGAAAAAGGAVAEGASGGALAVQASNAVSVSAMSELQLQSSSSRVSVAQQPGAAQRGTK